MKRSVLLFFTLKLILNQLFVFGKLRDECNDSTNKKCNEVTHNKFLIESDEECMINGLCPEYYNFCAEPSLFEKTRKIPKIDDPRLYDSLKLIQVQSIIRHGARTPTKYHKCWEGLNQSWNCDELVTTVQAAAFDMRNRTQTLEFSKHYDIRQWENNLNGTCKMGQLILQGYEQHRINGKLLAEAYFKGENLVTRSGLKIGKNYRDEIYIRSSDMQRTTVSAAALLTSLLEEFLGKEETFRVFQKFPLHTMDIQSDYLFANSNVENITDHLQAALSSKSYFDIVDKHQSLYQELEEKIKTPLLKDLWPGDIMDCIMTTICTRNHNKLPKAFIENNLLNRTISAIEKELSVIYTWNDSILSKSEMSRLLFDVRDYIVDVILFNEKKNDEFSNIKRLCSSAIQGKIDRNQDSLSNFEYLLNPLCSKYEQYYSLNYEINIKVPKFILFSGHDTTVIPTLASLEIWDEHWPPYASTFIIEIYNNPMGNKEQKHDYDYFHGKETNLIQESLPYYIRLLYNGQIITNRLKECFQEEICHVSLLYKHFWEKHNFI
ncbi:histidine acid phosphatase [Cryptosporidium sp. chipmunk genotype I]|uniref:histidine acid phosphatase n=1 Tax=Cryptosporidium sp. chipmunk genotype I TaxID=1280935 RepID=UPI00351A69CC|nr:histidine acid phosphatase [Cryptosporidium sp. chipmunk genotype I]